MPDLDGFEVAQRLRATGRPVPVLFLTARDSVEDRISGLTVGADDYVTKPFSLEEVVLRIRAILRRSRRDRRPSTPACCATPTWRWTRTPTRSAGAASDSSAISFGDPEKLVFIRHKKIKGHLYAYLVRNRWDKQNNKVKQGIVKYLGNSSKLMLQDIPREYQNDPNIVTFISTHTLDIGIIEGMESSLMDELLKDLMNHDIDRLIVICEKYSRIFGLAKFYERVLTPVMYKVGNIHRNY